jgi:two-component system, OmpR family, response regulator
VETSVSDLGPAVIIEDDADIRNLLESVLRQSGFKVCSAALGRAGVELVRSHNANVVTVDVGLPDIDGFEVLRRIRDFSDAYVVMLTAKDEEGDVLTAFHGGADDYIRKPIRPRELRARLAAVMRRPSYASPDAALPAANRTPRSPREAEDESVIRHNGLELNHNTRTVMVQGCAVSLTRSEFDLLHELLRTAGIVCTRARLVQVLHSEYRGDDKYINHIHERAVEAHIGNLRRKLGDDRQRPRWIETVRGVGYRLAPARPDMHDDTA